MNTERPSAKVMINGCNNTHCKKQSAVLCCLFLQRSAKTQLEQSCTFHRTFVQYSFLFLMVRVVVSGTFFIADDVDSRSMEYERSPRSMMLYSVKL